jgi:diacylglycerol O-acyltransferase
VTDAAQWGGPATMSAWEALMWRSDTDPRTRSTGILLELLADEPDWARLVAAHERVTSTITRLRDRVVEPPLPLVQPVWSPDPRFDLANHLQSVRLAEPGSPRRLLELCESLIQRPFDRTRPPWEATLVTGLQDGKAAYLLKIHHSLTDGLGLIQLLELVHSDRAAPRSRKPMPAPKPAVSATTPAGLLAGHARDQLVTAPHQLGRKSARLADGLSRVLRDPLQTVEDGGRFVRSLGRMMQGTPTQRSPLLRGSGGVGTRLLTVEAPLDELRAAAKAAGASVNDAFLAAVLGGMRLYHEVNGEVVDRLPIGMPISLRATDDPLGGNKFAGVRFAAPLSEKDPVARMLEIRDFVLTARAEPAVAFVNTISPALSKLPAALIIELTAKLTASSDLQISNIRGIGHPLFIAGVEIEAMYPMGPRPGVAAMIAMITYNGQCCVGLNVDPGAFPDPDELERCMRAGFAEVISVGTVAR